jgi:hypothetical protein
MPRGWFWTNREGKSRNDRSEEEAVQPYAVANWPDWTSDLSMDDQEATKRSLRNLARYANPVMLAMLGIGTGAARMPLETGSSWSAGIARGLAEQLREARGIGYWIEPFRPGGPRGGQIIRTASELLEGQGTCVDFAVAVAAGCVRAQVPVYLCVLAGSGMQAEHVFLAIPPLPDPRARAEYDPRPDWQQYTLPTFRSFGVDEFIGVMLGRYGCEIVDPTPPEPGADARSPVEVLEEHRATAAVHMVLVQKAVTDEYPPYQPDRPRSLGITALLPDLPADIRQFPSRAEALGRLDDASGTVVVLGEMGVGKSTLALIRAHAAAASRGWFLDASDRDSLRTSLAAAEAQCTGGRLDNGQKENIDSLVASARHRLAAADRPWVVVIDNADAAPEDVTDLLPRPRRGQLVIITSTNQEWAGYAQGAGWEVIEVGLLDRGDLSAAEQALPLPDALLCPGLVRLGLSAAADGLNAVGNDVDVPQLLRSLFGDPASLVARLPHDPVASSLVAAAVMPPEEVWQDWLAKCLARPTEAAAAIERLVDIGVLETSRRIRDVRTPERRTFWLHRLVRAAVRETYVNVSEPEVVRLVCRVLALEPQVVRSREDLFALSALLQEAAVTSAEPALPAATLTVLNSLELRGWEAVEQAATLAEAVLHTFPDGTEADWRLRSTPMLAMARRVVQDGEATPEDVTKALAVCEQLIAGLAADQSVDGRLVRGRTEAVRALLLRKRASGLLKAGDQAAARPLLEQVIDVLTRSFIERSEALGWKPPPRGHEPGLAHEPDSPGQGGPLVDDPDHHIDRSWFNLGGAYIDLAKVALSRPADEARKATLIRHWSDGLWGYAGSLWLRRDDNMYRAASLWGVALVLYTAALNGAVPLDLNGIPRSEAIDGLWGRQDRTVLLRVAEECATRAHAIRSDIAGPFDPDTRKTRALMRKVSAAWLVEKPTADQADAAGRSVAKFLREDLGLPPAAGE